MVSILLNNGSRRKGRVVVPEGERHHSGVRKNRYLGKTNTKTKLLSNAVLGVSRKLWSYI